MNEFLKKYSILIKLSLVESLNYSAGKFMVNSLPTFLYLSIRYVLMTIVGLFVLLWSSESRVKFKIDMKSFLSDNRTLKLGILSGLLYGTSVVLYYKAFSILPLTYSIITENVFRTIIGTLLGYFLLKEIVTKLNILYITLILFGTYLVLGISIEDFNSLGEYKTGLTYMLISNFILCVDNLFVAKIKTTVSSNFITSVKNILTSLLVFIYFLFSKESINDLSIDLNLLIIGAFLFTIVGGYFVRYANVKAVRDIGVHETTLFHNLSTVLAVLAAMILFNDWFTIIQWIGFIIVIVCLYLNTKNKH